MKYAFWPHGYIQHKALFNKLYFNQWKLGMTFNDIKPIIIKDGFQDYLLSDLPDTVWLV